MNLIQQIGAYAGFAAVVGLAVLSALYFSQARDVRRLREWAARSPDRAAGGQGAEDGHRASAREEPARASAERAAAPAAAAGVAAPAAASAPQRGGAPAVTALRSNSTPPAPPVGARGATQPPTAAPGGAAPGAGGTGAPSGAARNAQARIAEPPARGAPNGGPAARSAWPYAALAVVGLLIVLGAAGFALGLIGGRTEPVHRADTGAAQRRDAGGGAALAPGQVTFSVLNGTNVDGLGKQVADELEAAGYRRGNVTNRRYARRSDPWAVSRPRPP